MSNPDDLNHVYQQTVDASNRIIFQEPTKQGSDVYMGVQVGGKETDGKGVAPTAQPDPLAPAQPGLSAQPSGVPRPDIVVDTPEMAAVRQQTQAAMKPYVFDLDTFDVPGDVVRAGLAKISGVDRGDKEGNLRMSSDEMVNKVFFQYGEKPEEVIKRAEELGLPEADTLKIMAGLSAVVLGMATDPLNLIPGGAAKGPSQTVKAAKAVTDSEAAVLAGSQAVPSTTTAAKKIKTYRTIKPEVIEKASSTLDQLIADEQANIAAMRKAGASPEELDASFENLHALRERKTSLATIHDMDEETLRLMVENVDNDLKHFKGRTTEAAETVDDELEKEGSELLAREQLFGEKPNMVGITKRDVEGASEAFRLSHQIEGLKAERAIYAAALRDSVQGRVFDEFKRAAQILKSERGSVPLGGGGSGPDQFLQISQALTETVSRSQAQRDPKITAMFEEARGKAEGFAEAVTKQRRGVLSDPEVLELSKKSSLTLESVMGLPPGTTLPAEEFNKARDVLKTSFNAMKRATRKAKKTGLPEDFETMFEAVDETRNVTRIMLGLYAEPPRTTRIMAKGLPSPDPATMTDEARAAVQGEREFRVQDPWIQQLYDYFVEMEKAAGRHRPNTASANANGQALLAQTFVDALDELKSEEELAVFIKSMDKPHFWEFWAENWYNAMLTGLAPVKNLIGSPTILAAEIANRGVAAGLDAIGTGMVRWIARTDMPRSVYMGEVGAMLHGILEGFGDALKEGWQGIRTMKQPLPGQSLSTGELPRASATSQYLNVTGAPGRAVDYLATVGPRLLVGGDNFSKAIAFRVELRAQALRTAYQEVYSEGLAGVDAAKRIQAVKAYVLNNPADFPEVYQQAETFAKYIALQEQLGSAAKGLSHFAVHTTLGDPERGGLSGFPLGRFLFPFTKIVSNSSKMAGEWTGPLSLLSQSVRDEIAAGGARRDLQMGKIAFSTMYVATMAGLAMNGLITGSGPKDKNAQQQWRDETGKLPHSFYDPVTKQYRPMTGLEPFNTVAGAIADMVDIISHAPTSQDNLGKTQLGIESLVLAISNNIGSKAYLYGITGLANGVMSGSMDDFYAYVKKTLPGMIIPYSGALRQVKQGIDPVMRQAIDFQDMLMRDLPGFSTKVPAERNGLGKPIIRDGGWWNPFYHGQLSQDAELWKVLNEHGIVLGKVDKVIDDITLSGRQYDKYQELASEGLAEELTEKLVGRDDLTDQDVERIVSRAQGQRRAKALREMREGEYFPELADKLDAQAEKKKEGQSTKPSPFSAGKVRKSHGEAPTLR